MRSIIDVRGIAFGCGISICVASAMLGCNKEAGGSTGSAASGSPSAAPKAGGGKPAVTLKAADVKAAYEAELNDMKKMNDPMDKKIAAFVARVGKPEKEEGGKKTWHAVDGANCTKFTIDSSGVLDEQSVDKADCGL